MANCSQGDLWREIRKVEDDLAWVSHIADLCSAIEEQAWNQGSFAAIHDMARQLGVPVRTLQARLKARWNELHDEVKNDTG